MFKAIKDAVSDKIHGVPNIVNSSGGGQHVEGSAGGGWATEEEHKALERAKARDPERFKDVKIW